MLYTALETLSSKASGATLTSSGHALNPGEALVVVVGSVDTAGPPTTVTHNGRTLRRRVNNANATNTLHLSGWIKGEYNQKQTGTVVVTWASAIVERAVTIGKIDASVTKEIDATKDETTATGTPGTNHTGSLITAGSFVVGARYEIDTPGSTDFTLIGSADSNAGTLFTATGIGAGTGTARECLSVTDALAIGCFLSRGPANDTAGTLQFDLGGTSSVSWTVATATQRVGTAGAPPVSNVTLQVGHLAMVDEESVRSRINGATSRTWATGLLALRARTTALNRQGITPTDTGAVEQIVIDAGGEPDDVVYGIDQSTGLWVVYEVASPGAPVASRDETGAWS